MDLCQDNMPWRKRTKVLTCHVDCFLVGPFAIALPLFFTMHYGKQVTAHYAVAGLLTATGQMQKWELSFTRR